MNQVITIMMALIRSVICDEPVDKNLIAQITPEVRKELYSLSKAHDLAHLVAYALKKEKAIGDDETSELFSKSIYVAVARYANIVAEQEKICNLLEKHEIPYVPLKGAVIRDYYPEAWMRTSCDIDILIHEEDLKKAEQTLVEELGYGDSMRDYHDVSLYSPTGVHLELHFSILENEKKIDGLLQEVWDHLVVETHLFRRTMEPAYFLFYQIAHTMYHFTHGGCGIRTLIDLWLLKEKLDFDSKHLIGYCEQCSIYEFWDGLQLLMEVWFGEKRITKLGRRMETYIVLGGVYGNKYSSMIAKRSREKNTSAFYYWLKRAWVPYEVLATQYELLKRYPGLFPFYQIKRWCKVCDPKTRKYITREVETSQNLKREHIDDMKELFRELKL